MDKYTCKNLIIDPETQGLEDIIGKEVYYHNTPLLCLDHANEDCCIGILKEIRKDDFYPFQVETPEKVVQDYACIIPKREEPKPKYVPLKNLEEFLGAHSCVKTENLDRVHRYLDAHGIWLKEKGADDSDTFCMVHELGKNGVFVGHADVVISEGTACTDFASWYDLYLGYTFLDGSPCGKLKETE